MKETRIIAALLAFICAVLLVLVLKALKTIFIPLAFALLLYEVLKPVVDFAARRKAPLPVSLTVILLVVFFTFYLLGLVVYANVNMFVDEFPRYELSLRQTLETTLERLNMPLEQFTQYLSGTDIGKSLGNISLTSTISTSLGSFFTFLGYVLLVLIFMIFIFSGQSLTTDKLNQAFNTERALRVSLILGVIQSKVRTYLLTKIFISAMTAAVSVGFILLFGVDFAVFAGLLIFTLNFIPNIGSIIATAFPILICFVEYGYSWRVPGLLVCLVSVQMFFGNFLEPFLMGRGLNLSPLVVILSLIFWGWVWGIIGMVIAVPLTSTLVIVFENIEPLRPIAIMMSGSKTSIQT